MEPNKSFVFTGQELAWLLSQLPGPLLPPLQPLRALPFREEEVRAALLGKGVIQAGAGEAGLAGVVAFLLRALAAGTHWLSLPQALLVRTPKLYLLLTPYHRCPGAWRLTPCPALASACTLLPEPDGHVRLGGRGQEERTLPPPEGLLYDWLVEQQWS